MRVGQARQAAVGDRDALGQAGGAGGVDHVGRVVRPQRSDPVVVGRRVGRPVVTGAGGQVLEEHPGYFAGRQVRRGGTGGDEERGGGVAQHVRDAFGGVGGVDREVGGARLVHGQQRRDHVGRAGHRDRHQVLGSDAAADQVVREAVGGRVEFGVAEAAVVVGHRGRVRCAPDLFGEEVREGAGGGGVPGVVPGDGEVPQFRRAEDVDVAQACLRAGDDLLQHPAQRPGDHVGGGLVEQVGGVLQHAVHAGAVAPGVTVFLQTEQQVELGPPGVDLVHVEREAGQGGAEALLGPHGDGDLEQRVVRQ